MSSFRAASRRLLLRASFFVILCGPSLGVRAPVSDGPKPAAEEIAAIGRGHQESGPVVSDAGQLALARLGVDSWHNAGLRGRGIKIAVLDSGFHDYRCFLGNALPATVTVQSFRRDGNLEARDSQHGILCGEVIHAIAPDAELLFANWEPDHPESFLRAAQWARDQGARVISCSLIMPSWSDGEGGGSVHASLAKLVGKDALFFASAGNLAQRHWAGAAQPDSNGLHQWNPGQTLNQVLPWGEERVSVEVYGPQCQNLELQVLDSATSKILGSSRTSSDHSPCGCAAAVVRFQPVPGNGYCARVRCLGSVNGRHAAQFHVVVLGGSLHDSIAAGSIPFPADGRAVHAIGAVDAAGQRLSYSSCGPNSAFPKPDFVATIPFPSAWRDKAFAGTSAAAPQAAALAALVWASQPNWNAEQVEQFLCAHVRDLGPPGHDPQTGRGLLFLPSRQ